MTTQHWGDRVQRAIDALRWLFIGVPLVSEVHAFTKLAWPLAVVALVSSIPLLWLPARPDWLLRACLLTLAAASSGLWLLMPGGLNSVITYTAVFYATRFLPPWYAIAAGSIAGVTIGVIFVRGQEHVIGLLLSLTVLTAVVLLGISRRDRAERNEQAQLALARAQTVAEERAVAAALAERARIARELHDVLAHSLSGLALNLQGARLMLLRDGASEDTVAQIERAQRLATEGIGEARKAVAALREDAVPLDRAIADLLAGYRLDTSARAELAVQGEARAVDAPTASTVLRAVQEALTNTRKHAPGADVDVTLTFSPRLVEVSVLDHQGRRAKDGPAGYGLRGMRERTELLGGRFSTGPGEDGWRVHLAVPA